ncbi:MAG: hypothetical protein QQW96_03940 [Tychonema bourrellyi B0820]|nr:hypothetical protein [Tychonema bourrellyi B0820]PJE45210.1 MAG: hypothetical protein CUR32_01010 [Flavobacterium sp.] [Flavobacterium sp. FEMGT703F]
MTKDLGKKTLILGLAVLGIACVGVAVLKQKEDQEIDKYLGEYQEEAYPIGQQEEDYSKQK